MKHPLSIAGMILFGGSWIYLLSGVGADRFADVISLHKIAIAQSGIVSGLGLWLIGVMLSFRLPQPTSESTPSWFSPQQKEEQLRHQAEELSSSIRRMSNPSQEK